MLEEKDFDFISGIAGIAAAAALMAKEMQAVAENFSNIVQSSADEYIPLAERLAEFIEEPDKAAGFVLVGNDTWLPKHLVNARKRQQRKVSRRAESGIVWTR